MLQEANNTQSKQTTDVVGESLIKRTRQEQRDECVNFVPWHRLRWQNRPKTPTTTSLRRASYLKRHGVKNQDTA